MKEKACHDDASNDASSYAEPPGPFLGIEASDGRDGAGQNMQCKLKHRPPLAQNQQRSAILETSQSSAQMQNCTTASGQIVASALDGEPAVTGIHGRDNNNPRVVSAPDTARINPDSSFVYGGIVTPNTEISAAVQKASRRGIHMTAVDSCTFKTHTLLRMQQRSQSELPDDMLAGELHDVDFSVWLLILGGTKLP